MYKVLSIITTSLLIITLFIDTSAYCEDNNDNDIPQLKEIVVTATKVEENPLDVPQNVTIITEKQIEESGAKNIADLLDKQAGLQVSDYGPEGAQKTLSIRGSTSAQVLVLVDGVRMNNSQSGGVDLSLIPLDNIERIEIVRGGNSSIYGADAVGGVINIITKKKEQKKFSIKIENSGYLPQKYVIGYGTAKECHTPDYLSLLDTQNITLGYYPSFNKLNIINILTFTHAFNGYFFTDNNYENRKRYNADLLSVHFDTSLDIPFKLSDLTIKGGVLISKKGVPGTATSPSLKAEQEDKNINTSIRFKRNSFFTDAMDLNLTTYYQYKYLHYYDPDPSYQSIPVDSTHIINRIGFDFFQNIFSFSRLTPLYGININYDSLNSTDLNSKNRLHIGAFTELPYDFSEKLLITPSLRYDYYSDFRENINFSIGSVFKLNNKSTLKTYISKSYRVPTFNDMYWPESNVVAGNPNLKPETGYSFEIGYLQNKKETVLSLTSYIRYIQDVILWLEGSDNKWRPSNYGEALYPGIEFQLLQHLTTTLSINLNYTYLYSFTLSGSYTIKDNKRVPYIPVHKIYSEIRYTKHKLNFSIQEQYTGKRFTKTTNEAYLDSFFITNLLFGYKPTKNSELGIDIYNLFNEIYELEPSYPLPGTNIKVYYKSKF